MEKSPTRCQLCNNEIKNRPGIKKYCSKCRSVRDKELTKLYRERKGLQIEYVIPLEPLGVMDLPPLDQSKLDHIVKVKEERQKTKFIIPHRGGIPKEYSKASL